MEVAQRYSPGRADASSGKLCGCVGERQPLGVVAYVFGFSGVFDLHVPKFFGVKYFTTIKTLHEFRVFVAGDDAYLRVFAGGSHLS